MGLIAHYPFNGDRDDITGNIPLTTTGTSTLITPGKLGNAYNMTSGAYITDLTDIPESLTVSMWVRHNGSAWLSEALFGTRLGSNGFMLYRNDGDGDAYYRVYYWYNSTSNVSTAYHSWPGISSIPQDEWFHIAQVRYADGRLKFYKNVY